MLVHVCNVEAMMVLWTRANAVCLLCVPIKRHGVSQPDQHERNALCMHTRKGVAEYAAKHIMGTMSYMFSMSDMDNMSVIEHCHDGTKPPFAR